MKILLKHTWTIWQKGSDHCFIVQYRKMKILQKTVRILGTHFVLSKRSAKESYG